MPSKFITPYHLRLIYAERKIKYKSVTYQKKPSAQRPKYPISPFDFHMQAVEVMSSGRLFVQVDECVFCAKSYQKLAWSNFGVNVNVSKSLPNSEAIAVVAAISPAYGLIHFE